MLYENLLKNSCRKLSDGLVVTLQEAYSLLVFMVSLASPFPKLNQTI